jgi:hypothetical protein
MDRNDERKLDSMLRARRTQSASPDLAARIIRRAAARPQVQRFFLWQALRESFRELHLPQPGYVLAVTLVLGMLLGFSTAPQIVPSNDTASASAQSFLADDEGLL